MSELIDIYDANFNLIGKASKEKAHVDGLWHRTFHLWLVSPNAGGSLMYQLRSPAKDVFPNLLDISAAGHFKTGERLTDGIRELREEFGIDIEKNKLVNLGYRIEVADHQNGEKNREFQCVFIAKNEIPIEQFHPNTREVYGMVELPIDVGMKLHSGRIKTAKTHARLYQPEERNWVNKELVVSQELFLPRLQNYYLTMHIMAERFLEGRTELSIS